MVRLRQSKLTPEDMVIINAVPLRNTTPRKTVWGEMDISGWRGMHDQTEIFVEKTREVYFLECPEDVIRCRISCFPVYNMVAPQIQGALTIRLEQVLDMEANGLVHVSNSTSNPIWYSLHKDFSDPRTIRKNDAAGIPFARLGDGDGAAYKSLFLSVTSSGEDGGVMEVKVYRAAKDIKDVDGIVAKPGKLEFHGLTLACRQDVAGWQDTAFHKILKANGIPDAALLGVGQATGEGYLAVIKQDETLVQYVTGLPAVVKRAEFDKKLKENEVYTLTQRACAGDFLLQEMANRDANGRILMLSQAVFESNYTCLSPYDAVNNFLLYDHEEFVWDRFDLGLEKDEQFIMADILRCNDKAMLEPEAHLYYMITSLHGRRLAYLLHKPIHGRVSGVAPENGETISNLDYSQERIGPFEGDGMFNISWNGREDIRFSFELPSHMDQYQKYLAHGFFTLKEDVEIHPKGLLSAAPESFIMPPVSHVGVKALPLRNKNKQGGLQYDPRKYCSFYDKDSFSIIHDPKSRKFVLRSVFHPKHGVGQKTMFMVKPKSGPVILGSHATPDIVLPKAKEFFIVLPGVTFKFSQGVNYYG